MADLKKFIFPTLEAEMVKQIQLKKPDVIDALNFLNKMAGIFSNLLNRKPLASPRDFEKLHMIRMHDTLKLLLAFYTSVKELRDEAVALGLLPVAQASQPQQSQPDGDKRCDVSMESFTSENERREMKDRILALQAEVQTMRQENASQNIQAGSAIIMAGSRQSVVVLAFLPRQ
jgi:hypothetical protein